MSNRFLAVSIFAVLLTSTCAALAQDQDAEAFEAYKKGRQLGTEAYLEFLDEGDGRGFKILRATSVLSACGNDGLEKAVGAINEDGDFSKRVGKFVSAGKFSDLTRNAARDAVMHALNTASSLATGFRLGVVQTIGLLPAAQKDAECRSAVSLGNELLR